MVSNLPWVWGPYCTEDRFIQVGPDGKLDSLLLTIVDDISLIGSAIGSQCGDALSRGELPDVVLDKGEVSGCRGNIARSEFISQNQAVFRDMAHHWHIVFKALVGHLRRLFLSFNTGGIDIEGVATNFVVFHASLQDRSVHPLKAGETTSAAHVPQPVPKCI
jgi:hypothetical protein